MPRVGAAQQASLLLEEKMSFLDKARKSTGDTARERLAAIFTQPLEPEVIHVLKALAAVEGKAQVNLPA